MGRIVCIKVLLAVSQRDESVEALAHRFKGPCAHVGAEQLRRSEHPDHDCRESGALKQADNELAQALSGPGSLFCCHAVLVKRQGGIGS